MRYLKKYLYILISLMLFVTPFFWYPSGELNLGGDSSRIYFFRPLSFKDTASYFINNLSPLGVANPAFYMLPFLYVLNFIYILVQKNPYILNAAYSGFLLAGSFILIYKIVKELENRPAQNSLRLNCIFAGLFFTLSPLLTFEWHLALYFISQIFIYPLIFYLFLRFLNIRRYEYIFFASIISFIFSINFNYSVIPWFLAFFAFFNIFFIYYARINSNLKLFIKGSILMWTLVVFVQLFHVIPQLVVVTDSSSSFNKVIFNNSNTYNSGLSYFHSIQPFVSLIYNYAGQMQYEVLDRFGNPAKGVVYDYNAKFTPIYFIYIFIVLISMLAADKDAFVNVTKKIHFFLLSIFLVLLFFMTANISTVLLRLYESLFLIPGFAMFRHYIGKFNMVLVFYYAILLGISLITLEKLSKKIRYLVYSVLFTVFIFSTMPFINGDILNMPLNQTDGIRASLEMDDKYMNFINLLKNRKLDERYLSFPLTNEAYQVLAGKGGGAYSGPSLVATLGGKTDINGLWTFSDMQPVIKPSLLSRNADRLTSILRYLNIGTILHNADTFIYERFPGYPYTPELKKAFPDQSYINSFILSLRFTKSKSINTYNLYNSDYGAGFLPHIYVPKTVRVLNTSLADLDSELFNLKDSVSPLVLLREQNSKKNLSFAENPQSDGYIEMRKVNPTKYIINVRYSGSSFNLVFSDTFNNGWKLYASDKTINNATYSDSVIANYKILEGNELNQASRDELTAYMKQGLITTVGNLTSKTIEHTTWVNGREQLSHSEAYKIDFISKMYGGTIQNDNLNIESLYSKSLYTIPEEYHFVANGYANAWHVDLETICRKINTCSVNKDGTFNISLVVEFTPQRYFYISALISLFTVAFCCGCLISMRLRR